MQTISIEMRFFFFDIKGGTYQSWKNKEYEVQTNLY